LLSKKVKLPLLNHPFQHPKSRIVFYFDIQNTQFSTEILITKQFSNGEKLSIFRIYQNLSQQKKDKTVDFFLVLQKDNSSFNEKRNTYFSMKVMFLLISSITSMPMYKFFNGDFFRYTLVCPLLHSILEEVP